MDPTENLKSQMRLVVNIVRTIDGSEDINGDIPSLHKVARMANELAEHVDALNTWLSKGGFLPDQWSKERT